MPGGGTGRRVVLESALAPDVVMSRLRETVAGWTGSAIPSVLRMNRVLGATVRFRRRSFVLELTRTRRILAPIICRGRVGSTSAGSIVEAVIRPSRQWILAPASGTALLVVAWALTAAPPGTTLRYALVVGALWALNVGLVAVPVGSDPAADQAALISLLEQSVGASRNA